MKGIVCLVGLAVILSSATATAQKMARQVVLGDSGLIIGIPTGWRNADQAPANQETIGAFQSQDNRASVFLSKANASDQADMTQIMQGVITNFETAFIVNKVGEIKTGKLANSPAVFTTLEADMRSAKGNETMAFRFYLAVLDTGRGLYLMQASCQAPVKPEREKEIMAMMRSLVKTGTP
jgi:hypothetical protein